MKADAPVDVARLMERVLERENLFRALRRVRENGGSAGADAMTVEALAGYLKRYWPEIRKRLLEGTYRPQPVRRVAIPKPGGGRRVLGIPTVLDRLIQQALLQVLQAHWDQCFSEHSYGFRPGRCAHQAVAAAQGYLREGRGWVVDLDLERFFDRVNHDKLMHRVRQRIADRRVLKLIERYLKAGAMSTGGWIATTEGTPQGGPLPPLLANLLLDELDRELERRGHRFARYADDCNIYVHSRKAGQRVMESVTKYLARVLKLKVNEAKSAVERPWRRKFLGFSFTARRPNRLRVADAALERFKDEVRRLRCYLWKQWGGRGYRELRKQGISVDLAWNTSKSAHGPWRLSRSPALSIALPRSYFDALGLPRLSDDAVAA